MIEMTTTEYQAYLNLRNKCAYLSDMFERIANWLNREAHEDYFCEDDEANDYNILVEWLGWGNTRHKEPIITREHYLVEIFYKETDITIVKQGEILCK